MIRQQENTLPNSNAPIIRSLRRRPERGFDNMINNITENKALNMIKVKDFDLAQTLECGQCFNFEKIADHEYVVIAYKKVLHIRQLGDMFKDEEVFLDFYDASRDDIENIWIPYFDLDNDYAAIKCSLAASEPRLKGIIKKYGGIHILNQDFFETMISFIISQNKSISQIKNIVRNISVRYGMPCGVIDGREYHIFPEKKVFEKLTEDDFRALKTGFRAPYLYNAVHAGLDGEALRHMEYADAKGSLMQVKGIGDKVANCILLFSLGFRDAFPVDVWIKRIMEEMYFGCDTRKVEIERLAKEKFGKLGGYAQQYLFMYARMRNDEKKI